MINLKKKFNQYIAIMRKSAYHMFKHLSGYNMRTSQIFHLESEQQGMRLDQYLAHQFDALSRSQIQIFIKQGLVMIDGIYQYKPKTMLMAKQTIQIDIPQIERVEDEPQDIELNIIYQDDHILVINKPPGLVVHPGAGHRDGTLVNALLYWNATQRCMPRAGIIHRLDKDTSGLMIIARHQLVYQRLIEMMKKRDIHRHYTAIVHGHWGHMKIIDAPIGRHPKSRTKMAVTSSGKPAVTHIKSVERLAHHSLLTLALQTGRTHQIRVHLAHAGHGIVGDYTYHRSHRVRHASGVLSEQLALFNRQALHAHELRFDHPITHIPLKFNTRPPQDFIDLHQTLINEHLTHQGIYKNKQKT